MLFAYKTAATANPDAATAETIVTAPDSLYRYSNLCLDNQKSLAGATSKPTRRRIIRCVGSPVILFQKDGAKAYRNTNPIATREVSDRTDETY